jgi:hypothetical protein
MINIQIVDMILVLKVPHLPFQLKFLPLWVTSLHSCTDKGCVVIGGLLG